MTYKRVFTLDTRFTSEESKYKFLDEVIKLNINLRELCRGGLEMKTFLKYDPEEKPNEGMCADLKKDVAVSFLERRVTRKSLEYITGKLNKKYPKRSFGDVWPIFGIIQILVDERVKYLPNLSN